MLFDYKTCHYDGFKIEIIYRSGVHVPKALEALLDMFFENKLNLITEWIPDRIYLKNRTSSVIRPLRFFNAIKVDMGFFCADIDDWNRLVGFVMCLSKKGTHNVSQEKFQFFSDEIGKHIERQSRDQGQL